MTVLEGTNEGPRLRLLRVTIQTELVWDESGTLSPGPAVEPASLTLAQARELLENMGEHIENLESQALQGSGQ